MFRLPPPSLSRALSTSISPARPLSHSLQLCLSHPLPLIFPSQSLLSSPAMTCKSAGGPGPTAGPSAARCTSRPAPDEQTEAHDRGSCSALASAGWGERASGEKNRAISRLYCTSQTDNIVLTRHNVSRAYLGLEKNWHARHVTSVLAPTYTGQDKATTIVSRAPCVAAVIRKHGGGRRSSRCFLTC